MSNHADLIIHYFSYLVSDYGFRVEQREFDLATMGNAFVIFKSSRIGIEIVIDRNQVLLTLGDQMDSRKDWFEFSNVLRYFAPLLENAYIFTEKTDNISWDEAVEIQLNRLASILRQYCEPLLNGDFSMRAGIEKIQKNRKTELLEEFNKHANPHKKKI
jgi:hypothetical protein